MLKKAANSAKSLNGKEGEQFSGIPEVYRVYLTSVCRQLIMHAYHDKLDDAILNYIW